MVLSFVLMFEKIFELDFNMFLTNILFHMILLLLVNVMGYQCVMFYQKYVLPTWLLYK